MLQMDVVMGVALIIVFIGELHHFAVLLLDLSDIALDFHLDGEWVDVLSANGDL